MGACFTAYGQDDNGYEGGFYHEMYYFKTKDPGGSRLFGGGGGHVRNGQPSGGRRRGGLRAGAAHLLCGAGPEDALHFLRRSLG